MSKKPLTPTQARKWSDLGHMAFIDALTASVPVTQGKFAFHGGTSLHLSWKSPRFSEDLDFLLARSMGETMHATMPKIEKRLRALLKAKDPDLQVEIRDKTKDSSRLMNYLVVISHPGWHGTAKVKAEFWQVEDDYLKNYETRFVLPVQPGDVISRVSQPLPAATLQAAYADKLTAFATRPHLKWRDVFDLWWIGQQIEINPEAMADRFLHHVQAYSTVDGLEPAAALHHFLARDEAEILNTADPDIRKWLPPDLWQSLEGRGITQIVQIVRDAIGEIAEILEARSLAPDLGHQEEPDASFQP